jgi:hypothetical protein
MFSNFGGECNSLVRAGNQEPNVFSRLPSKKAKGAWFWRGAKRTIDTIDG